MHASTPQAARWPPAVHLHVTPQPARQPPPRPAGVAPQGSVWVKPIPAPPSSPWTRLKRLLSPSGIGATAPSTRPAPHAAARNPPKAQSRRPGARASPHPGRRPRTPRPLCPRPNTCARSEGHAACLTPVLECPRPSDARTHAHTHAHTSARTHVHPCTHARAYGRTHARALRHHAVSRNSEFTRSLPLPAPRQPRAGDRTTPTLGLNDRVERICPEMRKDPTSHQRVRKSTRSRQRLTTRSGRRAGARGLTAPLSPLSAGDTPGPGGIGANVHGAAAQG